MTTKQNKESWEEVEQRVVKILREIGVEDHIPAIVRVVRHENRIALAKQREEIVDEIEKDLREGKSAWANVLRQFIKEEEREEIRGEVKLMSKTEAYEDAEKEFMVIGYNDAIRDVNRLLNKENE